MAAITHDVITTNGEYTTKDGQVKTKFHKCGVAMLNNKGETSILIESLPTNFNGWLTLKVPKPRDAQEGNKANGYQPQAEDLSDIPDDIPF